VGWGGITTPKPTHSSTGVSRRGRGGYQNTADWGQQEGRGREGRVVCVGFQSTAGMGKQGGAGVGYQNTAMPGLSRPCTRCAKHMPAAVSSATRPHCAYAQNHVRLIVDPHVTFNPPPQPCPVKPPLTQPQVRLNPDEIIVCEITIDQGMKAQNPMTNVRFYQTTDPEGGDEPFAMPQQQVTSMLGTVYQGAGGGGGKCGFGFWSGGGGVGGVMVVVWVGCYNSWGASDDGCGGGNGSPSQQLRDLVMSRSPLSSMAQQ